MQNTIYIRSLLEDEKTFNAGLAVMDEIAMSRKLLPGQSANTGNNKYPG